MQKQKTLSSYQTFVKDNYPDYKKYYTEMYGNSMTKREINNTVIREIAKTWQSLKGGPSVATRHTTTINKPRRVHMKGFAKEAEEKYGKTVGKYLRLLEESESY